jgi:hypothetical protein
MKEGIAGRRGQAPAQITAKLREAEVSLAKGKNVGELIRSNGKVLRVASKPDHFWAAEA